MSLSETRNISCWVTLTPAEHHIWLTCWNCFIRSGSQEVRREGIVMCRMIGFFLSSSPFPYFYLILLLLQFGSSYFILFIFPHSFCISLPHLFIFIHFFHLFLLLSWFYVEMSWNQNAILRIRNWSWHLRACYIVVTSLLAYTSVYCFL